MTAAASSRGARGAATVTRLLDAASSLIRSDGAAAVSVHRVADVAGTSKALVHYHFAGKDALLVACAHHLAAQLLDAEDSAMHRGVASTALDELWESLMNERVRGPRRALLALMTAATPGIAEVLAEIGARRHDAAMRMLARAERLLGFSPRVPRAPLAAAYLAIVDGLTIECRGNPEAQHRSAFDAFWLAVLSLDG